jgi:hypothetical protein
LGVGASVLAWAHANIGEAIQRRDSKRAGVFMAIPWRDGGLAGDSKVAIDQLRADEPEGPAARAI